MKWLVLVLLVATSAHAGEHSILCQWWQLDQRYQECGASRRTPVPDGACTYSDADKHVVAWGSMEDVEPTRQPILNFFDTNTQKYKHVIGFMCHCDGEAIPEGTTHLCHD